jgi:hypothetical protein
MLATANALVQIAMVAKLLDKEIYVLAIALIYNLALKPITFVTRFALVCAILPQLALLQDHNLMLKLALVNALVEIPNLAKLVILSILKHVPVSAI